jgi:4-diphosphocytidyl-2-C-methyl-D-erythritol kinase
MTIISGTLPAFAPAKVNLHLAVKDRRPDGFHNIESVFLAINFGDTLYFDVIKGKNTVEIAMEGLDFPFSTEENIIYKAVSLFREKTGFDQGVKIRVDKRIPLGGGLGGGSSDAASALLTLNKIAGSPCSREILLEMAASLGSDVSFFIYRTPAARVTGRGECILPINAPLLFLVLVNPGFPSDTSAAYKLLDAVRGSSQNAAQACEIMQKDIIDESEYHNFSNDFLGVFPEPEKSVYSGIIAKLRELGAQYANLSGAGAACFGVFADRWQAQKAADALKGKWAFVQDCSTFL